jgi:hypothetical protein
MPTTTRRLASTVKINGQSYKIATDQDGNYLYSRRSAPKINLSLSKSAASGEANLVEFEYSGLDGFGDALMTKDRNRYHFATNFLMEHEGEAVALPSFQYIIPTDGLTTQEVSRPPVGLFEIVQGAPDILKTYIVQDCEVFSFEDSSGENVHLELEKTFEAGCVPSDTTQFNNLGYVAMGTQFEIINIVSVADNGSGAPNFAAGVHNLVVGDLIRISGSTHSTEGLYNGIWIVDAVDDTTHFEVHAVAYAAATPDIPVTARVHKINNRYLRSGSHPGGSRDDNNYQSIESVADAGGVASFTCTGHGYSAGDKVYLVNMTVDGYNSMSRSGVSALYTITAVATDTFDIEDIPYTATATGAVNRQDSDVFAEHLIIVGDLMVRAYKDIDLGWVTSRVDVVDSDVMHDANWTAGIGTVGVGDQNSPITDLVAIGEGEVVMKAEGAFTYKRPKGQYTNEIPELEEHRHPENGRGSTEYKGWVYIPTVIGTYRYRNGQTQDVTPGRDGVQEFTTPIGPIGWFASDVTRLYAITKPFKVNQPKNVDDVVNKVYIDYDNAGSIVVVGDWNLDPETDLDTLTAAGYIYLGSTVKWHRMFIEMDAVLNTLAGSYSGLYIDTAEYWNGSAWTTRSNLRDYTRVRDTSAKFPSSLGQSGDLYFDSEIPSDWDTGGTTPLGADAGTTNEMYWCRFSLSDAISDSVIIRRIIAGVHSTEHAMTPLTTSMEMSADHGGMQFVLTAVDGPNGGVLWRTLWGWQRAESVLPDDNGARADYGAGGAQPVGACAIVQPNALRAGPTGHRFLFVGLQHISYLCPLGHVSDPTEDGPNQQLYGGTARHHWLVFPDTDCGLPAVDKTLQEVDFDLSSDIVGANVDVFYRVDSGAWTRLGDADPLPVKATAGSEPTGLTFGLAIHVYFENNVRAVALPRLRSMPVLRVQPRPEMAETITMSVELSAEKVLRKKVDRRSAKSSYGALKTLQEQATSVAFVDVDESTDNVHVLQVSKRARLNSHNHPTVVADIVLSVVP